MASAADEDINSIVNINLKIVSDNFSRSAKAYDEYAVFQKHSAASFAERIRQLQDKKFRPEKILEIGCGTGLLTEKLIGLLPDAEFTITDISGEMLESCRKKTAGKGRGVKKYQVFDISSEDVDAGNHDFIVSALTLQWIPRKNLENIIHRMHGRLKDGAIFAFSILAEKTFLELRKSFNELGVQYPGPEFLDECDIRRICSCFSHLHIDSEIFSAEYPSTIEFLKNLQRTGTANATGRPVGAGKLKKIICHHNRKYSADPSAPIRFDYHTLFCICRK